ncbi:MAG: PsbP-related protein, partial [Candidatus Methanoperedens sp.]|nr:PsbP-related protein [Candidatus Methanoperedens sp.]
KPFDYQTLQPTSKTYTNSLYGFSIIQPSGWNVNQDTSNIIQFDSPKTSGKSASILVNIYDINIGWFDTEKNREDFIDRLKRDVSNFVLLKNTPMTINGKKAYSFTYVNTISSGENRAAQEVYIERNDKQVFLVGYVADSKQFETYDDVFTKTLNSFKQN